MSTIVVRDDANGNAVVCASIIGYKTALDPIVISETQIADKRHQRIKGSFFVRQAGRQIGVRLAITGRKLGENAVREKIADFISDG